MTKDIQLSTFLMISLYRFLVFFILLSPSAISAGIPKDSILDFHFNYRADVGHLFYKSGVSSFSGYLGEADATMILYTEKLGWWKGGGFYVQGMNTHGKQPSGMFTQDYQVFSNIEADPHTALYEVFYGQDINDFTFRIGQLDMNADFMLNGQSGNFINSSFGVIPTASLNMPLSIFALLTRGVVGEWQFRPKWAFKSAIYDGEPNDFNSNPNGIKWIHAKGDGFYQIDELTFSNERKRDSVRNVTLKLGAFVHTMDRSFVNEQNDTENPGAIKGAYMTGDFLLAQNVLGKQGDLYFFAIASMNEKDKLIAVKASIAGGFGLNGVFAKDESDYFGMAFTSINPKPKMDEISETTVELTYRFNLNQYISLQPNVQYFLSDYHNSALSRKGLVGFVRLMFSLPE